MKEINTYDELRNWKFERQYITGICGNDTINFPDKLWTMELYKKKNGSDLSAIFKLNDESWFVHDFKLSEHIETWKIRIDDDGFEHHSCPNCKSDAIFEYISEPIYDEDYDGEWHYITDCITDINEHLTPFCPFCGTRLKENEDENEKFSEKSAI